MTNQSKLTWSTGKVIALCLAVACLTLYGSSKTGLFVKRNAPLSTGAAAAAVSIASETSSPPQEPSEQFSFVRVNEVFEGDVIKLTDGTEVNLLGVSCPKLDETDPARLSVAREAVAFTTGAVLDREVRLEYEPAHLVDASGRTLAYVYLRDGTLLNGELIKRGYGNAFTRYAFSFSNEFNKYELAAKRNQIGLWEERETEGTEALSDSLYDANNSAESLATSNSAPGFSSNSNSSSRPRSTGPPALEVRDNDYSSSQEPLPAPRQSYNAPPYLDPGTSAPNKPRVAENGSYYGELSERTGRPKTVHVQGYTRRDGTYVRGHFRSKPRR